MTYSIPDFDLINRFAANFCLASGRRFNPFTAKPEDIFLEDIATGLSNIARFGGQAINHARYTVAEHSVIVSMLVPKPLAARALLHDAPEGLGFNDLVSPVKRCFQDYATAENFLMAVICKRFGLDPYEDPLIKAADGWALTHEQLLFQPNVKWLRDMIEARHHPPLPDGVRIYGWDPEYARSRFMDRAFALGLTDK